MPYLTQLAAVARRTGHPVTEVAGWRTRGHGPQPEVAGIVCHHTAGPSGGGDYPSLAVVRSGRPGLDGPLSHYGIGRSGRIYVIAAGRCWHNAPSTSAHHTNSRSLGIEAENNGRQPWPAVQLDAYRRLCAELCREFGLPAARVKAHREVNTGKPDPHSISMSHFRADVALLLKGGPAAPKPAPEPGPHWTETMVKRLPTLKRGATGEDVQTLQALLQARSHREVTQDGAFGPVTDAAVRAVQRWGGVPADGVCGPRTWPVLLRVHR